MSVLAPVWLLALLPWFGVVAYLLWGRRRRVDVPFLNLWPARVGDVRVRRRATPPPVALAMAILATLLAILAAGRPVLRGWGPAGPWSVVIDRGWTMAGKPSGILALAMNELPAAQPLGVWTVPSTGAEPLRTTAMNLALARPPELDRVTALLTGDALRASVRARLAESAAPMLVFTNQPLGISDERVIQIAPAVLSRNVAIVSMSAREMPTAQVMLRLRATAGFKSVNVRVGSAQQAAQRAVPLPEPGGEVTAFFDMPRLGQSIKAELTVDDDQPGDNAAWLVREASWPRIQVLTPLPAYLQRMVDVYARQRPPTDTSKRVVVETSEKDLPAGEPGVLIAPSTLGATPTARSGTPASLETVDHPITRGVTGAGAGSPAVAPEGPPAGWTPVVSAGGKVWVAIREQPIRGVWIGFDSDGWARSSEFVVFWANVFNWVGAGDQRYASEPVGSLEGDWQPVELAASAGSAQPPLWPGLYGSGAERKALNAPEVPFPTPASTDWRERLARVAVESQQRVDLMPALLLAALACLAVAALSWKRREPGAT